MEAWFPIIITICIIALTKSIFSLWSNNNNSRTKPLPPGPPSVPLIGSLLWLRRSLSDMELILRRLKAQYGPIITIRIGHRRFIFISSHTLAYRALIQKGNVFSDRPALNLMSTILNPTQVSINTASYGLNWRILRRNLINEIFNPARVKSHSGSRSWVLSLLVKRLLHVEDNSVMLIDHFQYAMFCLLVLMCFGDRLEEGQIKEIESVHRKMLVSFPRFRVLNLCPIRLSKILFCKRWKELIQLRQDQENVLLPLIKACVRAKQEQQQHDDGKSVVAYVDSLMYLTLPEENDRKLNDVDMVSLCGEFLNAGTDTTSTSLQWIMANLVKYPVIQHKLYQEIVSIMGPPPPTVSNGEILVKVVEEEELQKMPYLKAVVLEGLRRHPAGHFVLPHKVNEDVVLDGYLIPKNASVNFMVADMGWDPNVWEDPMEFKPERFLSDNVVTFDVTGSKEIKMMPFGAGRRMCPASSLAMLHLEYFVVHLIWYFEWTPHQGEEIDLTEKFEFTTVMKNPLFAEISPRTLCG